MPAHILILDGDPWLRHAAQREMDRDPEGWLEQRLKVIALVGSRHPDAVFPPPRPEDRPAPPPPPTPERLRFYPLVPEGRPDIYFKRREAMKARLKAEREKKP